MKIVHVSNLNFSSSLLLFILGLLVVIAGMFQHTFTITAVGGLFLIFSFAFIINSLVYRLILTKGEITEITMRGKINYNFSQITRFDCEIVKGAETISIVPIIHATDIQNRLVIIKTRSQVALYDIYAWVQKNYPSAIITDKVNNILSQRIASWLYKSIR